MTLAGFINLNHYAEVIPAFREALASTSSATSQPDMSCTMSQSHCSGGPSTKCFVHAAILVAGGAAIGYFLGTYIAKKSARVNTHVQLGCDKVVDTVDVEDIGEKKVFCRCWKSAKFPYCDGAHSKHNNACGDNVGPLVVKGKTQ